MPSVRSIDVRVPPFVMAGRFVAHADVAAWLRSWGTPDKLPRPRPKPR